MALLATQEQARFLWFLSWWGLATGTVGIWNGWVFCGSGVVIGSFFARAYWRNPVYSWRRTLDIAWVQLLIWSHAVAVWRWAPTWVATVYLATQLAGAGMYGVSWWFTQRQRLLAATACHATVHAAANLSLIFLYSQCSCSSDTEMRQKG